jgi:hypothetical protein
VREAKVAAARRGITLTALVTATLAAALRGGRDRGMPALPEGVPPDFRQSMEWFEAHKQRLTKRYPGEYLAIVGARVVDHDPSFDPLARRVFARFGVRSIFMPRIPARGERDAGIVNVPSPRLLPE